MANGFGIQQAVKNFFDAYFTIKKLKAEEEERAYQKAFAERQYQFNLQKFLYDITQDELKQNIEKEKLIRQEQLNKIQMQKDKWDFLKNIQVAPKEYTGETFTAGELKQMFPDYLGDIVLNEGDKYIIGDLSSNRYETVNTDRYTLIRDKYTGKEIQVPKIINNEKDANKSENDLKAIAEPISKMAYYIHLFDTMYNPKSKTLRFRDPAGKEIEVNINQWDAELRKYNEEARLKAGFDESTWKTVAGIIEDPNSGIDIKTKNKQKLNKQLLTTLQVLEQEGLHLTPAQKHYIITYYKYRNRQNQIDNK